MNSLATIQFRHDLWYVDGGLYNIAIGLRRLMDELGIRIHLNSEVSEVRREGGRVTGLVANETFHAADIVVSNMEVIPAYEKLLREDYLKLKERIVDKLERMGLKDLRKHTVFEHVWTPLDIRAQYHSNKGSIYGVVSDRWKNLALPLFCVWNSWWAMGINAAYVVLANFPCILAQRYNRARLLRLHVKRSGSQRRQGLTQ